MNSDDFTASQQDALRIAHSLADMGAPVFAAYRDSSKPGAFLYPNGWQHTRPGQTSHNWINRWRPGMALCMVTGVLFDVLDFDPQNGGDAAVLPSEVLSVRTYGAQRTPSTGAHWLIARTHLAKGVPAKGIDLQAGDDAGEGRGFVFIAPTVRPAKFGPNKGEDVEYRWEVEPFASVTLHGARGMDPGLDALIDLCQAKRATRTLRVVGREVAHPNIDVPLPDLDPDDAFEPAADWTEDEAEKIIRGQLDAVRHALPGAINSTLGGAARVLGRFVAGGFLNEEGSTIVLLDAVETGGQHSDSWNAANGLKWTAASVIATGLARGGEEPWTVASATSDQDSYSTTAKGEGVSADTAGLTPEQGSTTPTKGGGVPQLLIESPASMAYWLQQELGRGRLSGFFARQGALVHTPRVDEIGYVPAKGEADDNGPAEIRPATPDTLAAKLQFLYACYKTIKDKETKEEREVPAMFPAAAAKAVVNAPEALSGLRTLRGVTHTPMVRPDGSILDVAGYDAATGYLFLPGQGVKVPAVPAEPAMDDVVKAKVLLHGMIEGFPFGTDDDRANYLGMLLTPLLRQVAPPPYKMFGIGAHQPGSGKSLLAEIAAHVHGAVWRSEVPEDEPEWRKATVSLLSTTSAPVIVLDNVTGILKSSTLAGLLTQAGESQDRALGSNDRMITYTNDRVWVVTGNNLSLSGDLVRRTITVLIDPNMANPETRTDFAIQDLPRWVREHRNEILWSLLVLIRAWVAAGMPLEDRKQSDGFTHWQKVVGGILATAGIPGAFDAQSGQRAAAGGDDDGLARVLDHLRDRFGDKSWSVAEALAPTDNGAFVFEQRDWLPLPVLDKLSRSEAAGRISFGWWLRNRLGRWVVTEDGRPLVIREAGMEKKVARWAIESR